MDAERLKVIAAGISEVEDVIITKSLTYTNNIIDCTISVTQGEATLIFDVTIYPQYPLQFHGLETIIFSNLDLIKYNHVNLDGSICVNTAHNTDLKSKIFYDVKSLKEWMQKYYLNNETDTNYEHLLISNETSAQSNKCFLFTNVSHRFIEGDYGIFKYAEISAGNAADKSIPTYIVQSFKINDKNSMPCSWSSHYQNMAFSEGIYIYIDNAPKYNERFLVTNWVELERNFSQEFLKFLYDLKSKILLRKKNIKEIPLLIGYKIPSGEVHWQCAIISSSSFPNYSVKTGKNEYIGKLKDQPINWSNSRNSSYHHFFGRGALHNAITNSKILVIGIGAIGSILATTFCRGGAKQITLADYDIKIPENVCRAEFSFNTGLISKTSELSRRLIEISPFIHVNSLPDFTDQVKLFINTSSQKIKEILETYDLIFDCSADNDVTYILESLKLKSQVVSIAITNHANELVCTTQPTPYSLSKHIFSILEKTEDDLYIPMGCWSSTFRASYNDINVMVQFAIKKINLTYEENQPLRGFYLTSSKDDGFTIKLNQF